MAKQKHYDNVYNVPFNERDKEIKALEFQRTDIEEDLEEAIDELLKLGRRRRLRKKLKRKKKKVLPLLLDSKNPDRVKIPSLGITE